MTLLRRELRARYKSSFFGVLWSYLQPLLMMIVYWLVFSVLLRATGGIHNYPQFVADRASRCGRSSRAASCSAPPAWSRTAT